jgi:hypothetical protein
VANKAELFFKAVQALEAIATNTKKIAEELEEVEDL